MPAGRGVDTRGMRQFIQRTWLPTVLFVGLCAAYVAKDLSKCGPIYTAGIPVTGLVVVPLIWWWLVARAERPRLTRGAAAGALCVVLTMNLAPILGTIWWEQAHPDPGGILGPYFEVGMALMYYVGVGVPIGGLVGVLLAILQRRWWRAPSPRQPLGPEGRHSWRTRVADWAMAGALIAVLASSVYCISAQLVAPQDLSGVLFDIGALWLVTVPPGATIGAIAAVIAERIRVTR